MTERLARPIVIEYVGGTTNNHNVFNKIKKWTVRRRQLHRGPSLIGTIEYHTINDTLTILVQSGSIGLSAEDLIEIARRMRTIAQDQRTSIG